MSAGNVRGSVMATCPGSIAARTGRPAASERRLTDQQMGGDRERGLDLPSEATPVVALEAGARAITR
jgi:hypothetical protein